MKVHADMILREIAGEYVLVPVGETALKIHGMISLTESGVLLWNKLQEDISKDDLVKSILAEYDIDEATAREDVDMFLHKLSSLELLEGE